MHGADRVGRVDPIRGWSTLEEMSIIRIQCPAGAPITITVKPPTSHHYQYDHQWNHIVGFSQGGFFCLEVVTFFLS